MRKNLILLITALTFCAALALPVASSAQEAQKDHHHYKLIDVGTFGGPSSLFSNPDSRVINNRGTATGAADTATLDPYAPNCFFDCFVDHAFKWKDGVTVDLGTLPGGASSFPTWVNNRGEIAGRAVLPNRDVHAVLLIPCDEVHPRMEACEYDPVEAVTEAPIRSAQILQAAASTSAGKMSLPEATNRFRSQVVGRHRGFGIPKRLAK